MAQTADEEPGTHLDPDSKLHQTFSAGTGRLEMRGNAWQVLPGDWPKINALSS